jgi:hypothetical protein
MDFHSQFDLHIYKYRILNQKCIQHSLEKHEDMKNFEDGRITHTEIEIWREIVEGMQPPLDRAQY